MFGQELDTERAFDTMAIVKRTRVRPNRLAAALACAAVVGGLAGPLARFARPEPAAATAAARRYVVRPGDTLWSIAKRVVPGRDPRQVADAIAAVNHVDPGHLVPGSTLLLTTAG